MSNKRKNLIYSVVLLSMVATVWLYRSYATSTVTEGRADLQLVHYTGQTMGTIVYNVKYMGTPDTAIENGVGRLLIAFNQSLSTYIPDSEISRFNKGAGDFAFESDFFHPVLEKSHEVWRLSNGAFDPTIAPLYRFWGFGPEKDLGKDTTALDSLRSLIGFGMISYDQQRVSKEKAGIGLDFGAVAKGYAVDLVCDYLDANGLVDHFVEIGGEIMTHGSKDGKGSPWKIGIRNPRYKSSESDSKTIIMLTDKGMATSGNYENFYEKNGQKYVHVINPQTGLAQPSNLLSATVITTDCMSADAWATALMVVGLEGSKEMLVDLKGIEAYLIYDDAGVLKSYSTDGFGQFLVEEGL